MATCHSCNAPIMWVPYQGTQEPLDVTPVLGGDFDFRGSAAFVGADPKVKRFTSHRDTCPDRARWSISRRHEDPTPGRNRPGYVLARGR